MKVCEGPRCEVEFEPRRSTARFHSATCRRRAHRASTVERASAVEPPSLGVQDVVRRDLEAADRLNTVAGQLALELARRLERPDVTGVASLSRELRDVVSVALAEVPADDEVTRARRAREEKRRAHQLGAHE